MLTYSKSFPNIHGNREEILRDIGLTKGPNLCLSFLPSKTSRPESRLGLKLKSGYTDEGGTIRNILI